MALSNRLLTAPLTVTEIATCLGASSTKVKELCTHPRINMWSKKKPVQIASATVNRATEWWKGDAGDCGITPPARVSTLAQVRALYDGEMNGWSYTPPSTWGRMLDFDGYYQHATPEIDNFDVPATTFGGYNIAASIGTRGDDSYSLNMSDISVDNISLDNWYVGIAIFNGSTLVGWIADQKGLGQYEYPTTASMVGTTYTIVPFYSKVLLTQNSGVSTSGALMPIPLIIPQKTTIVSISSLIAVGVDDALWNSSRTIITFSVVVVSNTNNITPFSSAVVKLRFIGNNFDDAMVAGEYSYTINLTSLAAYATYTQSYSQIIPSAYQDSDYAVWVRLISGNDTFNVEGEEVSGSDGSDIA